MNKRDAARRAFMKRLIWMAGTSAGCAMLSPATPALAWVGTRMRRSKPLDALSAISACGLSTNLKLCLDAANSQSYDGSSQSWLDLSGNGNTFYLGSTNTVESSDPAFHGVAGNRSDGTSFTFDGTQGFLYSTTNTAWMNSLHKDGAVFTMVSWVYLSSVATIGTIMATLSAPGGSNIGVSLSVGSTANRMSFTSGWPGGSTTIAGTLNVPDSQWLMLAVSVNENGGATAGTFFVNGVTETFNPAYGSPTTSDCDQKMGIATRAGSTGRFLLSGSKMAMACCWQGTALTATQLNAFYNATRERFGV